MSIITNLRSIYESNEIFENSYYTPIMEWGYLRFNSAVFHGWMGKLIKLY